MTRRDFLDRLFRMGLGSLGVLSGPGLWPVSAWAEDAMDLGIRAQEWIQAGEFDKAVALLIPAVEQYPDDEWLLGLLARCYFNMGRYRAAARICHRIQTLHPGEAWSRMTLERIKQMPLPEEAEETAVERRPTELERKALEEEQELGRKLRGDSDVRSFQIQRIVLDPGHGGFDPGAVGPTGLKEKDVTLALALDLEKALAGTGKFQVHSTRGGDYYVPLGERTITANQRRADLFVSLHINASENRSAHGTETYYCSETASNQEAARLAEFENSVIKYDEERPLHPGFMDIEAILFDFERHLYWEDSKQFAHRFQDRFGPQVTLRNRGVQFANFFVLRTARMPSLLLETGFISNPREEQLLREEGFRRQMIQAAVTAIREMSRA